MGKYDAIISNAKVALTDANVNAFNATNFDCNLKLKFAVNDLMEMVAKLENTKQTSVFSKFKGLMFENQGDLNRDNIAALAVDTTHQLNLCLRCRCASCPIVEERKCLCKGCMYGAYVVSCPGGDGIEVRKVLPNTVTVNNRSVINLEHDRLTGYDTVVLVNANGIEQRCGIDIQTGQTI